MAEPTISAIMPLFNGERHVGDAIASVIAQTLPPSELIIVDDGSTDGSRALVEAIETPFPKTILDLDNRRQGAARNLAASHATGKYLAFLDHDDVWYPRHLEVLVGPLEADARLGWSYSDIDEMDGDGGLIEIRALKSLCEFFDHPKTSLFKMLESDMFIFPSAAIVRADAFRQAGGFDNRLSGYEDDDLFLRLFRNGWLNHFEPDSQVRYRRHPTSSGFSERMWISREIFAQKLIETFPDDRDLVRYYVRDIIAPRFYRAGHAEYIRHLPHERWEQCVMSVDLMRRYSAMMHLPWFRRTRRALTLAVMRHPRVIRSVHPFMRWLWRLPWLR